MRLKLLCIGILFVLSLNQMGLSLSDTEESKLYFEAIVNLKSIEKYFLGEPIYLSKDERFKSNVRDKLGKIIEYIEQYYQTDSDNPEVLFYLGKCYSYAHDLDIKGSWRNSVKYLNKLIKIQPDNVMARMIQAKNYMDSQNFEKALKEYEYANKLHPNGQALKFIAVAKIYLKREEEAKEDLKLYLKYNPNDRYAEKMLSSMESGLTEVVNLCSE
ncbi:MAG: tetratricopeptide repeat protein [Candidatus Omnitrophica bacterium]|nr:tetratricopeptide repeat protein [Candidatus Omnitrophota bacterium]